MNYFEVTEDGIDTFLKLKDDFEMIYVEDNTLQIKPKIKTITDPSQLSNYSFTFSNIVLCTINNTEISSPNYSKTLENIYAKIGDGVKIIQTPTTFHLKTIEYELDGFEYMPGVGISYQRKDANGTIKEILVQAKHHNIHIDMEIKLQDGKVLNVIT